MFCNKCGTQLPDEAQFCTTCGNSFRQEAPEEYESYMPPQPADEPAVYNDYPMPPVDPTPQPQPEPPKKKNTGLIVGIAVGVIGVLVAVFCILAFVAPGFLLDKDKKGDEKKNSDETSTSQVSSILAQGGSASDPDTKPSDTDPSDPSDPSDPDTPDTPVMPDPPQIDNPDPLGPGTPTQNTNLYNEVVKPIFEGNKMTMVCSSSVDGVTIPMTLVVDGNNFVMVTSFKAMMDSNGAGEDFPAGMIGDEVRIIFKDGKGYTLMEMFGQKFYMEEDALDMDADDFTGGAGENMTYVKTTTVKNGNKTYTCEEYKTDGGTSKFYFEGKKLVRIESISGGQTAVIEIQSLTATADQKYFSLKGYSKFDESAFG